MNTCQYFKLTKEKEISNELPKCSGGHLIPYNITTNVFHTLGCSDSITTTDTGNTYKFSTTCGGFDTKHKTEIWYQTYTACHYDTAYWPEQAGIKPLQFTLDKDLFESTNTNTIYKDITFYPNIDDTEKIDSAFVGAQPINLGRGTYRFEFHLTPKTETINTQETFSCETDSGKTGKTGPGQVPKVSLDWSWSGNDINRCSDGNYCDATQLTIEILNRINKAKELLSQNQSSIECPLSASQIVDQALAGKYNITATPNNVSNDIPAGKIGISDVRFSVNPDTNEFYIKIDVQNRTGTSQTGTLSITNFGSNNPTYIEDLGNDTNLCSTACGLSNSITTNTGDDDTSELLYHFGGGTPPILGDYNLNIKYTLDPAAYVEYGTVDSNITLSTFPPFDASNSSCQTPAMTAQFNGIDYIDYWFNEDVYPASVQEAWTQEKIKELKDLLNFKANLITDNYNTQFINDFDKAYGGKASQGQGGISSFMSAPGYFQHDYLSPLFKNNLIYSLKYLSGSENNVKITAPGTYNIRIDLFFGNENWKFTKEDNETIDANAVVTFNYINGPIEDSVFYRIPFDGFVGLKNNGYDRQGYGVSYLGNNDLIIGNASPTMVTVREDKGSNPLSWLTINKEDDIFKLNSDFETRGNVLTLTQGEQPNHWKMTISPSVATPVIMKVERTSVSPFNVYYKLIDSENNPMYGSPNLTRWTGIISDSDLNFNLSDGSNMDYSGIPLTQAFYNTSDVATTPGEVSSAYKLSWPSVLYNGTIYLRTIFYTPYSTHGNTYTLQNKNSSGDPKVSFTIPHNGNANNNTWVSITVGDGQLGIPIDSIKEVFNKIDQNQICVTNSDDGTTSEFWWNPKEVYKSN